MGGGYEWHLSLEGGLRRWRLVVRWEWKVF